jgi:hypothetical protein
MTIAGERAMVARCARVDCVTPKTEKTCPPAQDPKTYLALCRSGTCTLFK